MIIDNPEYSKIFKNICRQAGQAVADYKMIAGGDRILVGLSGGKDSMTLMHVLSYLQRHAPVDFEIIAVTFDPGFSGFDSVAIQRYARMQGWTHHIIKFAMDDFLKEKGAERRPCVLCSRIRRGKLCGMAEELGCGKIALGHNLDDICVSMLISLSRGQGMKTMGPNVKADESKLCIIRPLVYVPEKVIVNCAGLFGFPDCGRCAYEEKLEKSGDRAYFVKMLEQMEERIPHIRQNMLYSMSSIRQDYLLDREFLKFE
ncbi:MAG: ATP-binding protein [Victivallaceae bacterium]